MLRIELSISKVSHDGKNIGKERITVLVGANICLAKINTQYTKC